jgi:Tol biopolymer transport system component
MAVAIAAAALAAPAWGQTVDRAEVALHAAMKKESVDGDLKSAIEQYKKLAQGSNKPIAARALVRLGECYEKQGNTDARKTYEQVLSKFGDQTEAVAQARARLAAMGGAGSGVMYRQVWAGSKVSTYGTVSPDGRYLSCVDSDTGDLALHDIVSGADRRLTNKGTQSQEWAQESAISRDGKQVGYTWHSPTNGYELRIAGLTASGFLQPHPLLAGDDVNWIGPYDWSPDGKWLAVSLQRKDRATFQIGLVSTEDGSLRVLKSYKWLDYPTGVFFSPDGKYLGLDLSSGDVSDHDVLILAVDGSSETKATTGPTHDVMMGWSPDGKRLLFASDRTGSTGLWAVPIADGKLAGSADLIESEIARHSLGVTTSGTLYVGVGLGNSDIQVASFDFNAVKLLSPPSSLPHSFTGFSMQPDWSPDGRNLVYVSERSSVGGGRVLAIRSVETGQVRELRPNLRTFNWPRWAPDGRSLMCMGTDPQGRQGIYGINAVTGEVNPVALSAPGSFLQYPEWSPDGKKIYFERSVAYDRAAGVTWAWIERDMISGSERELIRRKGLGAPSISPDSRYLAAKAYDSSTKSTAILLIPTAGGEPRELFRYPAEEEGVVSLVWTPDGRGVLATRTVSGKREVWLVPTEGGQARKLAFDLGDTGWSWPIRVHPDGRQIVYIGGGAKKEVWALENFLPKAAK